MSDSTVSNVAVVIVSHSPEVARGTADMVRQMVGDEVAVAWCGGNPDGGLGTDVQAIVDAINRVWNEAGVVVLVDLGGAEMNAEMAVDLVDAGRRDRIVVCDAPIVEGAVMAAAQASTGRPLAEVRAAAEDLGA